MLIKHVVAGSAETGTRPAPVMSCSEASPDSGYVLGGSLDRGQGRGNALAHLLFVDLQSGVGLFAVALSEAATASGGKCHDSVRRVPPSTGSKV